MPCLANSFLPMKSNFFVIDNSSISSQPSYMTKQLSFGAVKQLTISIQILYRQQIDALIDR